MYTQKSFVLKPDDADKKWYLVDAADKTVGRIATQIADILRGKNNPQYTPHTDSGDFVVVINADKVKFTGNKLEDKVYYRHTGYAGGLRERTAKEQLDRRPSLVLMSAVKGMLPKNPLGRAMFRKLKVYAGAEHPHVAQQPQQINI